MHEIEMIMIVEFILLYAFFELCPHASLRKGRCVQRIYDEVARDRLVAGRDLVAVQYMDKRHFHLHVGEPHPDAVPRAEAERHEGGGVAVVLGLGRKVLRIELGRLSPKEFRIFHDFSRGNLKKPNFLKLKMLF